ncbi:hypothetical protein WR164_09460 [Philodulcilactobacillus myokoensis]|uniref:Uncharacterized protein n=1 Tax=Philodulcilactobacillus myokoensis TaxID=2929573 RepID=A0A9W6B107_9LACO|nr:hypothetical protein [Philodulcilactobacillus myokoensis]GLB46967.1 hypothetical protein WR164_09460 [Philodulcilactobacillus myokoensis]
MLTLNLDRRLGNQEVMLSDSSTGQLTGVRIPSLSVGSRVVQWTFVPADHDHEGFAYAGFFKEGQVIESFSGVTKYKINFIN